MAMKTSKNSDQVGLLGKGSYHPLLDGCSFFDIALAYILLRQLIVGGVEKEEGGYASSPRVGKYHNNRVIKCEFDRIECRFCDFALLPLTM